MARVSRLDPGGFEKLYACRGPLGHGSFGRVLQCVDRRSGKDFAVKFYQKRKQEVALHQLSNLEMEKRNFARFGQIRHDHIVLYEHIYEDAEALYLVQERLNGPDLFDFLSAQSWMSEPLAALIVADMLRALAYVHDVMGVVHRDVKPENFVFKHRGDASGAGGFPLKLVDFSLSKWLSEVPRTRVGTLMYMAPEQLDGEKYNGKVDVWAVGIILYVMLSGSSPFPSSNAVDLRNAQCLPFSTSGPRWAAVNGDALSLLRSLLAVQSGLRPTASVALEHRWLQQHLESRRRHVPSAPARAPPPLADSTMLSKPYEQVLLLSRSPPPSTAWPEGVDSCRDPFDFASTSMGKVSQHEAAVGAATMASLQFAVFIDLLGFGILFPVLPFVVVDLGGDAIALGLLACGFSAAQMVGGAVLGHLARSAGRKKVLLACFACACLSYWVLGAVWSDHVSVLQVVVFRSVTGLFSGTVGLVRAYVSAVSPPSRRPLNLSYTGATSGFALVLGPAVGGYLFNHFGFVVVAWTVASLCASTFCVLAVGLPNSQPTPGTTSMGDHAAKRGGNLSGTILSCLTFCYCAAFGTFEAIGALFYMQKWGFGEAEFAKVVVLAGASLFLCQLFLVAPIVERLGDRFAAILGHASRCAAYLCVACMNSTGAPYAFAVLSTFGATVRPITAAMLTRHMPYGRNGGAVADTTQAAAGLGRTIGPLVACVLYTVHPEYAWFASAGLSFGAVVILFIMKLPGDDKACWQTPPSKMHLPNFMLPSAGLQPLSSPSHASAPLLLSSPSLTVQVKEPAGQEANVSVAAQSLDVSDLGLWQLMGNHERASTSHDVFGRDASSCSPREPTTPSRNRRPTASVTFDGASPEEQWRVMQSAVSLYRAFDVERTQRVEQSTSWLAFVGSAMENAKTAPELTSRLDCFSIVSAPGCGKSTLLKKLQERGHIVILEPMEELFSEYTPITYSDLSRWAFTFQTEYMDWMTRVRDVIPYLRRTYPDRLIFVERSPRCQLDIFVNFFKDGNVISEWELSLLRRIWQRAWWEPSRYLYVALDPSVALARLRGRARDGEGGIDEAFLNNMHELHERVYGADDRVLRIDASLSPDEVLNDLVAKLKQAGTDV